MRRYVKVGTIESVLIPIPECAKLYRPYSGGFLNSRVIRQVHLWIRQEGILLNYTIDDGRSLVSTGRSEAVRSRRGRRALQPSSDGQGLRPAASDRAGLPPSPFARRS